MFKPSLPLGRQLEAFHTSLLHRASPASEAALRGAAERLRASGIDGRALREGDPAPDFTLANQHGRPIRLADRLTHTPVVLLFIRGGWCPYCTLTLRAYQDALPDIHAAGGDLLAVTPQVPANCAEIAERDLLAFPLLTDPGNAAARSYGVGYDLDPGLRDYYLKLGHDLPRLNGTGDWRIPLPATFVIGQDGRIVRAHAEPVVHHRLEPAEAVQNVRALQAA